MSNIIDHVLRFDDEDGAIAALEPLGFHTASEDGAHWDGSRVIAPISVVTADAVWEDGDLVSPRETLPGFWLAVALPELSAELRDLPDSACRLIADRAAAERGQPFIAYAAPDIDMGALSSARIDPVFAGAGYPFGG